MPVIRIIAKIRNDILKATAFIQMIQDESYILVCKHVACKFCFNM